jgi:hypothetical protein
MSFKLHSLKSRASILAILIAVVASAILAGPQLRGPSQQQQSGDGDLNPNVQPTGVEGCPKLVGVFRVTRLICMANGEVIGSRELMEKRPFENLIVTDGGELRGVAYHKRKLYRWSARWRLTDAYCGETGTQGRFRVDQFKVSSDGKRLGVRSVPLKWEDWDGKAGDPQAEFSSLPDRIEWSDVIRPGFYWEEMLNVHPDGRLYLSTPIRLKALGKEGECILMAEQVPGTQWENQEEL